MKHDDNLRAVATSALFAPIVRFWDHRCPDTGWLSNFYAAPVAHSGVVWPTSEHLYQSLKFHDPDYKRTILSIASPKAAKAKAHEWEESMGEANVIGKARIMREAIMCKFTQHLELADKLLATTGRIVEASPTDHVWGVGAVGHGLNLMGMLLMELRSVLKANDADQATARRKP